MKRNNDYLASLGLLAKEQSPEEIELQKKEKKEKELKRKEERKEEKITKIEDNKETRQEAMSRLRDRNKVS